MSFSIQFECNDKDAAPNFILIDIDRRQFIIDKKFWEGKLKTIKLCSVRDIDIDQSYKSSTM
jgi:hypothetical protein